VCSKLTLELQRAGWGKGVDADHPSPLPFFAFVGGGQLGFWRPGLPLQQKWITITVVGYDGSVAYDGKA